MNRKSLRNWEAKYSFERFLGICGLLGTAPLLGTLSLLIKATSSGPIFYVTERLGREGRVFKMYKFRSMREGSKQILAEDGKVLTSENDSRLTPIGKFLRLGFDELPQLLNVVAGSMCLVGPRPDVPWELQRYTERERKRLEVLPGITGLTQIVGGRELNNAQNYELDVRYVEKSSAFTDLAIVLLTIPYSLGMKQTGRFVFLRYLNGIEELSNELRGEIPKEVR